MASTLSLRQISVRLGNLFQSTPRTTNEKEEEIIETGDFRIDLRTRSVFVRDQAVLLDSEEFDMLVFLTGHPRRVITPRTLLSTRWGNHEVRQTDFLRVLANLRKKIEAAGGFTHYIRTEPWVFYRFDPTSQETPLHHPTRKQ
jgi:two-component system, OmpR family, KDP operon response regulator KdpE